MFVDFFCQKQWARLCNSLDMWILDNNVNMYSFSGICVFHFNSPPPNMEIQALGKKKMKKCIPPPPLHSIKSKRGVGVGGRLPNKIYIPAVFHKFFALHVRINSFSLIFLRIKGCLITSCSTICTRPEIKSAVLSANCKFLH